MSIFLNEAVFKPQIATSDIGLNLTDPSVVSIPKLADIPGRRGHNLIEASRTQIISLLHNAEVNKMAFCIWGDTGVSKSATVNDFFKELHTKKYSDRKPILINGLSRPKGSELKGSGDGVVLSDKSDVYVNPGKYFFLADVRVSLLEEIDLKGVPNIEAETNIQTSYTPPLIHLISQPDAAGIIFFDEVNRTNNSAVKSALLSVFDKQNKRLGDALISQKVFPVAAANIGFGFTDVAEIDLALKNRGGAAYLNLTVEEWLKYAKEGGSIHPAVVAFIESLPNQTEFLFKGKPPTTSDEESFINLLKYPTYRGYELLSDGLKAAIERKLNGELPNDNAVITEAILQAGAVTGHAFAEEFGKFLRQSASALSLSQIEKMDKTKSGNLQALKVACHKNLLAYADMFYNDKDKPSEKQLKAWSLVTLQLPPEIQLAIWNDIKNDVANKSNDVKQLPGKIAAFMVKELELAKAEKRVEEDTYNRIISALQGVAGLPPKP